jgi:HPt (histidine-containing phosphotransfer) domain-containing protein
MPAGPLATDLDPNLGPLLGPLDFDHLERMTLGEKALEREVLEMFLAQSAKLIATLASLPVETAALAHTLKGSARAIGAFKLAERADVLEAAGQGDTAALAALQEAVAEARSAIEARLGRS